MACQRLCPHLGPVLFQFPTNFRTTSGRGGKATSNIERLRRLGEVRTLRLAARLLSCPSTSALQQRQQGASAPRMTRLICALRVQHLLRGPVRACRCPRVPCRCCPGGSGLCLSSGTPHGSVKRCTMCCGSTTGAWPSRTAQARQGCGAQGCWLSLAWLHAVVPAVMLAAWFLCPCRSATPTCH